MAFIQNPLIAIVGAGDHCVRGHLNHLNTLGARICGVFDPKDESLPAPHSEIQRFRDLEIAVHESDAVLISSPDRFHLQQMKDAIGHGCHVFCEKPLASSEIELQALQEVLREAKRKQLTITTCHPRRFDPPYVAVKVALPDLVEEYGPVIHVGLDFSYHKPSKTGLHGGSMLQDHANHEVDYLCFLLGGNVGLKAYKLHDEEDRYAMSGMREDGVSFLFQGTRRLDEKIYTETIQVRFERAELFVDTHKAENSYLLEHESRDKLCFKAKKTDYDKRFFDLNQHWLAVMAGKTENYVDAQQMLLNTQMSVMFKNSPSFSYRP